MARAGQASCPHVYLGLDSFLEETPQNGSVPVVLSMGTWEEWESGAAIEGIVSR